MALRRFVLLAAFAALATGCATTRPAPLSVADTIARDPQLSTLSRLLQQAGLADTLRTAGPYTVFAPTDDAFKAVPATTMAELAQDPAKLKAVLAYHVLPAHVPAAEVKNGNATTAGGANVALAKAGAFVTVEDAMVQSPDAVAANGVVHTIDRVLMPPKR